MSAHTSTLTTFALLAALGAPALAADAPERAPGQEQSAATAAKFRPPVTGAPATRVGGATRGPEEDSLRVTVIAPETTAWASTSQPTLYWYASGPVRARIEVVLIEAQGETPLLDSTVDATAQPGLQAIELERYGVHLVPGQEYEWSVAVVQDPEAPSRDIVSSGTVVYQPLPSDLERTLSASPESELYEVYAGHGYWFDAVDDLARRLRSGGATGAEAELGGLLREVALPEVAEALSG